MGDFIWTEDVLRWTRCAAAASEYYPRLASRIAAYLPPSASVLDAGCGAGQLSMALSPYVKRIVALDRSALALSGLAGCPGNVLPLEADAFAYEPENRFDALLLCYFAHPDEFMQLSRLCRGKAFLVCDAARSAAYEETLTRHNILFCKECFSLRLDQPLRSLEDARAYAARYGRPLAKRSENQEFPYRDSILREMALLRYSCGGRHEEALQ